ncbi:hypothetical protein HanXRQr2_Chr03g0100141 [Helianthus annuus]|uniref:Uncharacterized protein n=1 Tax=Helianthus annuus TaxID=4232 RepID=A0A251V7F5_HELAN|nr:hypothetical protein HanXRQr2_Chr03g0100141 [Helianthus annuus]KAJ0942796.1 hypothetical protein HanPSC8_Chr03g0096401 [Helianthus annuus]
MEPEDRSLAGLFLSFQSPVEIPGVSIVTFCRWRTMPERKLGQRELDPLQVHSF